MKYKSSKSGRKGKKLRHRKSKVHKRIKPVPSKTVGIPRKFRRNINHSSSYITARNQQKRDKWKIVKQCLPENLKHLLFDEKSPFSIKNIKKDSRCKTDGYVVVPQNFSIISNPEESYLTLKRVISSLFLESSLHPTFDYQYCTNIGLETQAIMDVILKERRQFWNVVKKYRYASEDFPSGLGGTNIKNEDIKKLLFTVGSPANLGIREIKAPDVVKCPLRMHSMQANSSMAELHALKEIDTTEMADYVIECMKKMNRTLTVDAIDNLCVVIGEILINAEEHSSTHNRISVGYFKDVNGEDGHCLTLKKVDS